MSARVRRETEQTAAKSAAEPVAGVAVAGHRTVVDNDWFVAGFAPSPLEAGRLPRCPLAERE